MKYQNISDKRLSLPGIGFVEPQDVIETDQEINNANFQKVEGKTDAPKTKGETKKDKKEE